MMTLQAPNVRAGILRGWDGSAYKATVQFDGSTHQFVAGISVARDISGAEMTNGRKVAVAFFDASNPADAVLFAVWT